MTESQSVSDSEVNRVVYAALLLWSTYDDPHGYALGKKQRVIGYHREKETSNEEKIYFIKQMFDPNNQAILEKILKAAEK